jgi:hypothetical protein
VPGSFIGGSGRVFCGPRQRSNADGNGGDHNDHLLALVSSMRVTPIWKLETALKFRLCRKGRYAPPMRVIKLTKAQETTPYQWVHPDEDR